MIDLDYLNRAVQCFYYLYDVLGHCIAREQTCNYLKCAGFRLEGGVVQYLLWYSPIEAEFEDPSASIFCPANAPTESQLLKQQFPDLTYAEVMNVLHQIRTETNQPYDQLCCCLSLPPSGHAVSYVPAAVLDSGLKCLPNHLVLKQNRWVK